jgi:hypothetical protein
MNTEELKNKDLKKWLEITLMGGTILWVLYLLPFIFEWRSLADRLFPILASFLVIGLASIQLLRNVSPRVDRILTAEKDETESQGFGDIETAQEEADSTFKSVAVLFGWIILFPILIYYLGFGLGTPIYAVGIFWYYHRDIKYTMLLTAILLIGMYVLFIWLLGLQVWDGALNVPNPLDYL